MDSSSIQAKCDYQADANDRGSPNDHVFDKNLNLGQYPDCDDKVPDDVQHLKTLQRYTHMMPLPDNAPLPMFSDEQLKQMVFKAACQTIGMSTSFIFMAL